MDERPTPSIAFEGMLMGRHHNLATAHARSAGGHLERSAYLLLSRIDLEGPMSVGQLAEAFGLNPSTLTRQTSALLREGLVERIADPDAGIARKFRITDEGMRRLTAERAAIRAGVDKVLADWPDEDVRTLAHWLRRFNEAVEQVQNTPWPRP